MTTIQLQQNGSARLLCGLAVLLSVAVVSADEIGQQRLYATIDVSEVFTPPPPPHVLTVTLSGTDEGQHFSHLIFAATELIDFRQFGDPAFPNPRAVVTDGEFIITAANGDTLTGTYDGVGLPDPDRPGFVNGTALAWLAGGTGRFRCASGWQTPVVGVEMFSRRLTCVACLKNGGGEGGAAVRSKPCTIIIY